MIIESKGTPPSLPDECASCDQPIKVRDRSWLLMQSTWGLAIAGNLCPDPTCAEIRNEYPENIAVRLRLRRRRLLA